MLAFLAQVTQSNGTQFKKSVVSKLCSPEAEPKPEISVHVLYKGCTVWGGKKTRKGLDLGSRKSGHGMWCQGKFSLGLIHQILKYLFYGSVQCSCLENPRDGGARWAAVYGVTQSRTRLK